MYPIPPLDEQTLDAIFHSPVENCDARSSSSSSREAIPFFELLEYIATKPSPKLPKKFFFSEFENFVDQCLKKNPRDRADLKTLMNHEWIRRAEAQPVDIDGWVCQTMSLTPNTLTRIVPNES